MALIYGDKTSCREYSALDMLMNKLEGLKMESLKMGDRRAYRRLSNMIEKVESSPVPYFATSFQFHKRCD